MLSFQCCKEYISVSHLVTKMVVYQWCLRYIHNNATTSQIELKNPNKQNWFDCTILFNKTDKLWDHHHIPTNFMMWWHVKVHFLKTENLCEKGTLSFQLFKMKMPRWPSILVVGQGTFLLLYHCFSLLLFFFSCNFVYFSSWHLLEGSQSLHK